mmetsp:Transcript_1588/g.2004  ORF Transcript_1588/g.2004 Transcript_1588/m.2004 type:complete len:570 (+) Transcript_1588:84-1793(+)
MIGLISTHQFFTYVLLLLFLMTCSNSVEISPKSNWWKDGSVKSSVVRERQTWSYSKQSNPILDMWWIIVNQGSIHIFNPDEISRSAITKANYAIYGDSLRVRDGVPKKLSIIIHDEPITSNEFYSLNCDTEFGQTSLFFMKPWFHENMYHLVNDAAMLLFHHHTTPQTPSTSSSSSLSSTLSHSVDVQDAFTTSSLSWRYPSKLFKFTTQHAKHHPTLPWANEVFFHSSIFPAGVNNYATSVIIPKQPLCIGAFHWGSPLRVLSAVRVSKAERQEAVKLMNSQLRASCPAIQSHVVKRIKGSQELRVVFVTRSNTTPIGKKKTEIRTLTRNTVSLLESGFMNATQGRVKFESCCDFSKKSPCEIAQVFVDADIVIGMHGAGLANAVFAAKSTGSILIELRTSYGGHLDIFSMLSTATDAGYMWVSMEKTKGGVTLPNQHVKSVAACAVHMFQVKDSSGSKIIDPLICRPIRSKGGPSGKYPGLFGYTPIAYEGDECYRKKMNPPCYNGLRTNSNTKAKNTNSRRGGGSGEEEEEEKEEESEKHVQKKAKSDKKEVAAISNDDTDLFDLI